MRIAIVGAGLAGGTAAALLKRAGHEVEVFETTSRIGGNCYDEWDHGVMVHRYGPHGFHTDKREVWDFVCGFAEFHPTELVVVANTPLGIIPVPFNDVSASIIGPKTREEIRELIFRDYTEKHWGIPWDQIPSSITSRVPAIRESSDCRYHLDRWQGVPAKGYTEMITSMFEGCEVHVGCEAGAWRKGRYDHIVYTGSIDEYFGNRLGALEYRSLEFRYRREPKRPYFQLNECNRVNPWTRSVDHSHWLARDVSETIVGYEYPVEWTPGAVRMYPKPFGANPDRFKQYWELAKRERNVTFVGRLATYKYLDMDDVIAQVMNRMEPLVGGRTVRSGDDDPKLSATVG